MQSGEHAEVPSALQDHPERRGLQHQGNRVRAEPGKVGAHFRSSRRVPARVRGGALGLRGDIGGEEDRGLLPASHALWIRAARWGRNCPSLPGLLPLPHPCAPDGRTPPPHSCTSLAPPHVDAWKIQASLSSKSPLPGAALPPALLVLGAKQMFLWLVRITGQG